ncbi:MAG: shikimate dehydrogenase, partial [Dehalococcoidia bacterium]
FQQAALDHLGIDARFEARPVPPEDFAAAVEALRADDELGGCVTLPHKHAALELMDDVDETAAAIGAVNTIVNADGRLKGYNTDAPGFLRALRERAGFDPAGSSAVVFGAGGAARAVVYALRVAGVARLAIANRTVPRAESLAADMTDGGFRPTALGLQRDELADVAPFADLLVNATSMGMAGGEAASASPVPAELISGDALCYDAVYAPPMTPFLLAAEDAGARPEGGLSMLIYQGAEGFQLWTGEPAPVEVMFEAAEAALRAR